MELKLSVFVHTQPEWLPVGWAEGCERCLPVLTAELLTLPPGPAHVLSELREVEISLVDDATIARVHAEFLRDPTPTDVITFPYGEILVSCDTAARYAAAHAIPPLQELFRYIVHGLTHLHGYLDSTPEERTALFAVQEPLVARFWNAPTGRPT